jgi:rare lipoprotein A
MMVVTTRRAAMAVLMAALVTTGCEREQEADPAPAAEQQLLAPDVLQRAAMQVPELRPEPVGAPQPNGDADPSAVPERVRDALPDEVLSRVTGEATFYADKFEGRRTASGIPFRQNQMVAAHRAYPFGTVLRVTNLQNNRAVNVRVVDRGPFGESPRAQRTIIDLSRRAAQQLGYVEAGRTPVRVEVLEWGQGLPTA